MERRPAIRSSLARWDRRIELSDARTAERPTIAAVSAATAYHEAIEASAGHGPVASGEAEPADIAIAAVDARRLRRSLSVAPRPTPISICISSMA